MAKKKRGIKTITESALRKKYAGTGLAEEVLSTNSLWLPSRFLALNDLWGGGAHYGKIHEIFGEESSGKSLTALDFAYCAQKLGGVVLWADSEYAFTRGWAKQNGLDLNKVELFQEKAIEIISDWSVDMAIHYRSKLINNEPILFVVDSIAALSCLANLDGYQQDEKAEMGNRAKAIDAWLRTRNGIYEKLGVTVILINQLRKKIGAGLFEDPDCVHYDTTIPLTDGTFKTIGEIVENKLDVKVWSYDKGEIVEKGISDWIAKDNWDDEDIWYNLQTTGPSTSNGVNGITATGGHLVMNSNNDWVRTDSLKVGDTLISMSYMPDEYTKILLQGMSIGDMGIDIRKDNSARITLRDNNNLEYVNWKVSQLSKLVSFEKDFDKRDYEYYTSDFHYFLSEIKREVNRDPLNCENLFNAQLMAIWYMDDGHLSNKGQVSISISPNRTNLYKLSLKLTLHGFECKPYNKGIKFTKKGKVRLLKHINKFIHPSMFYKLPEEFIPISTNTELNLTLNLKPVKVFVKKIEPAGERNYRGKKGRIKYDLSIEGTKNFLAGNTTNGFVIHNTTPGGMATRFYASIRAGYYGGKQITAKVDGIEERVGRITSVRIKKNKIAPPKPTLKGVNVYFHPDFKEPVGFDKYFGLPEILQRQGVISRKKGSSRYMMGDEVIANGELAFLKKLKTDAEFRKMLIDASDINTISKMKSKLKGIKENMFPISLISNDSKETEDEEEE